MKGIVGVLKPMAGESLKMPGARIAYLPQQSELDRSFPARVVDLVSMGLWPRRGLLGRYTAEDREAVTRALMAVGLEGFEARPIDTLSGGQLQRALFARVLVQDAEIILLDEPFNAIDARTVDRPHRADQALARREADGDGGRPRPRPRAPAFSRDAAAGAPSGGLGADIETLKPENLLRARRFDEAWHDDAPWCEPEPHETRTGIAWPRCHGHAHSRARMTIITITARRTTATTMNPGHGRRRPCTIS